MKIIVKLRSARPPCSLSPARPGLSRSPHSADRALAAGGGMDAVMRIFAAGYEAELKQPVNVVNRTGGGGLTGHTAIATATPDG